MINYKKIDETDEDIAFYYNEEFLKDNKPKEKFYRTDKGEEEILNFIFVELWDRLTKEDTEPIKLSDDFKGLGRYFRINHSNNTFEMYSDEALAKIARQDKEFINWYDF